MNKFQIGPFLKSYRFLLSEFILNQIEKTKQKQKPKLKNQIEKRNFSSLEIQFQFILNSIQFNSIQWSVGHQSKIGFLGDSWDSWRFLAILGDIFQVFKLNFDLI